MPHLDDDSALPEVTDEMLRASLERTVPYTVLILKAGPRYAPPGPDRSSEVERVIWQHGKRNMALRVAGLMPVICPIGDGSGYTGVSVVTATVEDTRRIYARDPAVMAGVLAFEVHATRSFPGSCLPAWDQ
jgi:hypothetical protein